MLSVSATRPLTFKISLPPPAFSLRTHMESPPRTHLTSASHSPQTNAGIKDTSDGLAITLQEWQGWGAVSPLPAKVVEIVNDLKLLEKTTEVQMSFSGHRGKLEGDFGMQENKKHRATYQALGDSEKKLQFFSARQIACRLLGSRGYLCQKCWLPLEEDCMCSKVKPSSLWHGIRFWLYMHPKDFLRQNNTGKLLWQVFGVESATLCLYGIAEDEEIMWNACKTAGKDRVWCLYPNKNAATKSVQEALCHEISSDPECYTTMKNEYKPLNFILIDGTWSNSAAMFNRLKEKTKSVWGVEDLPCISLSAGVSTMHKLRPQPSWDRTCTAAAAIGLLSELQILPQFSSYGLDKQSEVLENAVDVLLDALTARRLRMGRSITRRLRPSGNIR
ncbi:hypothetical protein OIU76_015974 [Salix suchowensis]|nr:hypothetical protein OIU76_015974 [Salix suchowensis]KAJ6379261.1 hypothetical protein OIU76_015974 [Salix suchowensis]KAJ6379263.1 hypothetical protein OIU76_015974 [Salix suchowensis]KAJ6379264.1 hypothetical protein OIU76_015974 [Salix suchowensis]